MVRSFDVLFLWFLFSGIGFSQSAVVIPRGLSSREGNARVTVPGKFAPAHAQFLYAASVMPKAPLTIRKIGIRRDGALTVAFQAHDFYVELWMSHLPNDPVAGYGCSWAGNRGKDWTNVVKKVKVHFPAENKPLVPPAPFSVWVTLNKPFSYRGGAFLTEWSLGASKQEAWEWYADAENWISWKGEPRDWKVEYYGVDYPKDLWMGVYPPFLGGALLFHHIFFTPGPRVQVVGLLGNSTKYWGSTPLPVLLHSFSFPKTPSNMGPWIQANAIILLQGRTPPGSAINQHQKIVLEGGVIPQDTVLKGIGFTYQGLGILHDPGAPNGFYLESTRAAKCTIGGPLTGWSGGFTFYGYHAHNDGWAWYYKPFALVMALK